MRLNIFELFLNPFQGKRYMTVYEQPITIMKQEDKKNYFVDHVSIVDGDFLIIVDLAKE